MCNAVYTFTTLWYVVSMIIHINQARIYGRAEGAPTLFKIFKTAITIAILSQMISKTTMLSTNSWLSHPRKKSKYAPDIKVCIHFMYIT